MAVAQPVSLMLAQVLCERGAPTRHVYFPIDAFVSLVAAVDGHDDLDVGMIGREGVLGAAVALGIHTAPWRSLVHRQGSAWRIGVAPFTRELAASPALRRGLHRYLFVLLAQLATSAACMRFHQIGPRLARWLLMVQDRTRSDRFTVTHESLARTLGVRRVGVTLAAGLLQRHGLIEYQRGKVAVLDRAGLEAAACSCYELDRQSYRDRLG
jgi:CRP-like cAMP-binding protein